MPSLCCRSQACAATEEPRARDVLQPQLINNLVRLEAPVELSGSWDGHVYVRLGRNTKHLTTGIPASSLRMMALHTGVIWPRQSGPSVDGTRRAILEDPDGQWIPFWRLTQSTVNLNDEDCERPLLSVFRFVRLSSYYVAAPRDDQ